MGTYTANFNFYIPDYKERGGWGIVGTKMSQNFNDIDTNLYAATSHVTGTGADHTYINQDVRTVAEPRFSGIIIGDTAYPPPITGTYCHVSNGSGTAGLKVDASYSSRIYLTEHVNGTAEIVHDNGEVRFGTSYAGGIVSIRSGASVDAIEFDANSDTKVKNSLYIGVANPVSAIESTLSSSTTSLPLSSAVKTYVDNATSGVAANTTHRTSNGTDHTYINQDLRTTASPTFSGETVNGNVNISGFTQLGNSPGIKIARYTGTAPSSQGSTAYLSCSIAASKTIAIMGMVYGPGYSINANTSKSGWECYTYRSSDTTIAFEIPASNGANVVSKSIAVTVVYVA